MSNAFQFKVPAYVYVTVEANTRDEAEQIVQALTCFDSDGDANEEVRDAATASYIEFYDSGFEYTGPC
jgi:hypothetical protein